MLTERQLLLFKVLVNDYIRSAEPVGSRTIAKRPDIHFSPATIRNELADLEDLGYLEKPHSSAGRVPSEKGYRFYVDHLLSPELLTQEELEGIRKAFQDQYYELEKLTQETANILSDFTQYTAIVLGPEVLETKLKHMQIIPLNADTAVLIMVTNTGHVENRTIKLPQGINPGEIEKLVNILNNRLKDTPLYYLKDAVDLEIKDVLRQHISHFQQIMVLLNDALAYHPMDHIYFSGKTKMLAQPEFRDVDKVMPLLNMLDNKAVVYELLRPSGENGIHIKIGHENHLNEIKNCSVITASYTIGGEHMGTVAVIGPTRMAYPKVVSLMEIVSKHLSDLLTKRYQE
ncbi:heat-inducible transcriptional repressor HrcA [Tuberibacillus calidus]|uniref:heat-inducible transcriptional repressor HrcA n=1 Tax=Tuberibacillus calidus TaxID=340097 RepID=UPI000400A4F0|nr:heat-inducible transcriptional repressor HrcA [Tuberibacillus calidus]